MMPEYQKKEKQKERKKLDGQTSTRTTKQCRLTA
jgi:hypothetical protein